MKTEEQKPSNPLAFPGVDENTGAYVDGMTLRDYFANSAMQAMVSRENPNAGFGKSEARQCYYIADAMLKQREL